MAVSAGVTPKLEVAFAQDIFEASPTWTDLSSYVLEIKVDRGRDDIIGHFEPGTLIAVLNNESGDLDSDNASGPFFGGLTANQRVRYSGVDGGTYPRFDGYSERWVVSWPNDGPSVVTLEAADGLKMLARRTMDTAGWEQFVRSRSPLPDFWLRLGDDDSNSLAVSAVVSPNSGQSLLGFYDDKLRDPVQGLVHGDANPAHSVGDSAGGIAGPKAAGMEGTGAVGMVFLFQLASLPSSGTESIWYYQQSQVDAALLNVSTTGALTFDIGTTSSTVGTVPAGTPVVVVFSRSAAGAERRSVFYADEAGALVEATSATAPSVYTWVQFGPPIWGTSNESAAGMDGVVDELMMWTTGGNPGESLAEHRAWAEMALVPGHGDMLDDRFDRLLDIIGWPSARRAGSFAGHENSVLTRWTPQGSALDEIHRLAATGSGDVYSSVTGDMVRAPWQEPADLVTPSLTLSDDGGGIPYVDIVVERADTDQATRVVVSDGVQTVELVTPGASDTAPVLDVHQDVMLGFYTDTPYDVALKLHRLVEGSDTRVSSVVLSMASLSQAQRQDMLGLELLDLVAVTRTPPGVGARTYLGQVIRISDSVRADGYTMEVGLRGLPPEFQRSFRHSFVNRHPGLGSGLGFFTADTDTPLEIDVRRWDDDRFAYEAPLDLSTSTVTDVALRGSRYLLGLHGEWDPNASGSCVLMWDAGATRWARATVKQGTSTLQSHSCVSVVDGAVVSEITPVGRTAGHGGLLRGAIKINADAEAAYSPEVWAVRVADTMHSARAYKSSNESLGTSGVAEAIALDSERFDFGGLHSTSSNTERFTAQREGWYLVGAQGEFASNATGGRTIGVRQGGADLMAEAGVPAISGTAACIATSLLKLSASEYVEMMARQTSGGALNLLSTGNYSPEFWIIELDGPGVRVRRTSNQTISNTTTILHTTPGTPLSFSETVDEDDSSMWDAGAPTQLVVPTSIEPGTLAVVWAGVMWASNSAGERRLSIKHDGLSDVVMDRSLAISNDTHGQTVMTLWRVNPGDTFTFPVAQSSGANRDVVASGYASAAAAMAFITSI